MLSLEVSFAAGRQAGGHAVRVGGQVGRPAADIQLQAGSRCAGLPHLVLCLQPIPLPPAYPGTLQLTLAALSWLHQALRTRMQAPAWNNPAHPWTICANVVWAVLFGWHLAVAHLLAALVQALTVVGIGTALTNVQLAAFAM